MLLGKTWIELKYDVVLVSDTLTKKRAETSFFRRDPICGIAMGFRALELRNEEDPFWGTLLGELTRTGIVQCVYGKI